MLAIHKKKEQRHQQLYEYKFYFNYYDHLESSKENDKLPAHWLYTQELSINGFIGDNFLYCARRNEDLLLELWVGTRFEGHADGLVTLFLNKYDFIFFTVGPR